MVCASVHADMRWAPLAGLPQLTRTALVHQQMARCLPQPADVKAPVYPHAVVIDLGWPRTQPECQLRDGWQQLGQVVLISADSRDEVLRWYTEALAGYSSYGDEHGTLFINTQIDDFLWERDYHKHPNVALRPVDDAWREAGYQVRIELNRPASLRPGVPSEEESEQ